jgi:hypothetical protein
MYMWNYTYILHVYLYTYVYIIICTHTHTIFENLNDLIIPKIRISCDHVTVDWNCGSKLLPATFWGLLISCFTETHSSQALEKAVISNHG